MDPRGTIFLATDHLAELNREAEHERLARTARTTGRPARHAGRTMTASLTSLLRVIRRTEVRKPANVAW